MFTPRFLLVPLAVFSLGERAEETLAFQPAAGTTLVRTFKSSYRMELESMEISLNGEEIPAEQFGEIDMSVEHEEGYVIRDVIESMGAGRPQRLRRTFDELSGSERVTFASEGGPESEESRYESALEGKSVVFRWNEESDGFEVAYAEDEQGEEALLEDLVEDMDLRELLPPGPVAEGASWDIEARVFDRVLDPGGDLALDDPESEDQDTSAQDEQLRTNLGGTIRATYKGAVSEEGLRQAVIQLVVDTSSHAEEDLPGDELPEGASGKGRIEVGFELSGELRWDLEHGHVLSFELSGRNQLRMIQSVSGDFEGETMEQSQTMNLAGDMLFSLHCERR